MKRRGRVVGVIGGLGPDATIDFMSRVMELTPANKDQDHIRLLVDQNPKVPNRQEAILENAKSPAKILTSMAVGLEANGADFIVMPCNAAHAFQDDIISALKIPFISIIDVTIDAISKNLSKIGILATPACIHTGLYQRALAKKGKESVELNSKELEDLMCLIYSIKAGCQDKEITRNMQTLVEALVDRGAEAIIVGCTEIPLVLNLKTSKIPLISSTDELAKKTVAEAVF